MPGFSDRVLITGASGFIGAHLTRAALASGAEVHVLLREEGIPPRLQDLSPSLRCFRGDVLDQASLTTWVQRVRPTHFIHSVHARGGNPFAGARLHVLGTFNVLEALETADPSAVLFLGSSTEYAPQDRPISEDDPLGIISPHGASKAAASLIATEWARRRNAPLSVLRLFQVFGPWDREDRLLPTLFRCALENRSTPIPPGWARRDWIHIDDVVRACLASLERGLEPGCVLNIGSGIQRSFGEVVVSFERILGHRLKPGPAHPGRPWDRPNWCADIRRAKEVLGWQPAIPFEEGFESTWHWYRKHSGKAADGRHA